MACTGRYYTRSDNFIQVMKLLLVPTASTPCRVPKKTDHHVMAVTSSNLKTDYRNSFTAGKTVKFAIKLT